MMVPNESKKLTDSDMQREVEIARQLTEIYLSDNVNRPGIHDMLRSFGKLVLEKEFGSEKISPTMEILDISTPKFIVSIKELQSGEVDLHSFLRQGIVDLVKETQRHQSVTAISDVQIYLEKIGSDLVFFAKLYIAE